MRVHAKKVNTVRYSTLHWSFAKPPHKDLAADGIIIDGYVKAIGTKKTAHLISK